MQRLHTAGLGTRRGDNAGPPLRHGVSVAAHSHSHVCRTTALQFSNSASRLVEGLAGMTRAGLHGLGIDALTCRWDEVSASNLVGLDKVREIVLSSPCIDS